MSKIWFITGSSRGFGRALVEAVLVAGDKVVATARKPEELADLSESYGDQVRAVKMDVTSPAEGQSRCRHAGSLWRRCCCERDGFPSRQLQDQREELERWSDITQSTDFDGLADIQHRASRLRYLEGVSTPKALLYDYAQPGMNTFKIPNSFEGRVERRWHMIPRWCSAEAAFPSTCGVRAKAW